MRFRCLKPNLAEVRGASPAVLLRVQIQRNNPRMSIDQCAWFFINREPGTKTYNPFPYTLREAANPAKELRRFFLIRTDMKK